MAGKQVTSVVCTFVQKQKHNKTDKNVSAQKDSISHLEYAKKWKTKKKNTLFAL